MAADRRIDVCLVSSHGGHLELLQSLTAAYAGRSHALVTPPSDQAEGLRAGGMDVRTIVNPKRSPTGLIRNLAQAAALVRRLRPRVVVSTGAGVAVPLCLLAKATGAKLIFIETMARVEDGSASGRLLYRFADHFLVQWPELLAVYPKAEVCRPGLLEQIGSRPAREGEGTMVATGTHGQPFDRLLRWADEAAGGGLLPAPVFAQTGPSTYRSRHLSQVDFISPQQMEERVATSRVVVAHGGSGVVATALRLGRRPLVMARRAEHREHVDDHQVAVTRKLAALGLVIDLDASDAAAAVAAAEAPLRPGNGIGGPSLVGRLRELIDEVPAA